MVIGLVNEDDVHRHAPQSLGDVEPRKAATHNDDAGSAHRRIVSRRQRAKPTTSATGGTAFSSAYAVYIRHRR